MRSIFYNSQKIILPVFGIVVFLLATTLTAQALRGSTQVTLCDANTAIYLPFIQSPSLLRSLDNSNATINTEANVPIRSSQLHSSQNQAVRMGNSLCMIISSTGLNPNATLTYTVQPPVDGLSIAANGVLTWIPTSPNERHEVTIHVSDGSHTISDTFVLRSLPAPGVPTTQFPHYKAFHYDSGDCQPPDGCDWVPDFAVMATVVVDTQLIDDAGYSDSTITWSNLNRFVDLQADDIILIDEGVTVHFDTVNNDPIFAIAVQGTLQFASDRSTRLIVGTLFIDGGFGRPNGTLIIDTPNLSYLTEIVFHGTVNKTQDPGQMSLGLVTTGGEVNMKGAAVQGHRSRVIAESAATVTLEGPLGFQSIESSTKADRQYLYFSDAQKDVANASSGECGDYSQTCRYPQQGELVTVTADGVTYDPTINMTTIQLQHELQYAHASGYAGFLSRNVILRSQNPNELMSRGHVIFIGPTLVNLYGVAFENLGRTTTNVLHDTNFNEAGTIDDIDKDIGRNQRGRYPLHMHHTHDPVSSTVGFSVEAVSIFVDPTITLTHDIKWGFVHHSSHGTLIDSVCVGEVGACFVGEAGGETGEWRGNLAIGTGGGSLEKDGHVRKDFIVEGSDGELLEDHGHQGYGYWVRGPMIALGGEQKEDGNIAAGVFGVAFSYDIPPKGPHLWASVRALSDLSGTDKPDACISAKTSTAYYRDCVLANAGTDGRVPISKITNHRFQNNVAVGTMLRGPLLEAWYGETKESERYRIQDSYLELQSRSDILNASHAIRFFYTSGEVANSVVIGTSEPNASSYQTTGIGTNDGDKMRLRIKNTTVEGFSVGIGATARAGAEFLDLPLLKNEVNIAIYGNPERIALPLDDGRLPWNRLILITGVTFYSLYPSETTQYHLQMRLTDDKRYSNHLFFQHLQPNLAIITNSQNCSNTPCTDISKLYVYDKLQAPDYTPFDGTWGVKQLADVNGNPVDLAGLTNQDLWNKFSVARGGILMPCSPVTATTTATRAESCSYGDQYGIDGYVDTQFPNVTIIIPDKDNLTWSPRYTQSYKICQDSNGDGYLECGETKWIHPDMVYLCNYDTNGFIDECQRNGDGEFYLKQVGVYSITDEIIISNGSTIRRSFLFARRN